MPTDPDDLEREKLTRKIDKFVEQLNILTQEHQQQWKSHDQAVLTLSAAAIGLSLTILDKTAVPVYLLAIYACWICFVIAIIATLLSFRVASEAIQHEITQITRAIANIRETTKSSSNPHIRPLHMLNNISGWAFVIGILLFIAFGIANVQSRGLLLGRGVPNVSHGTETRGTPDTLKKPGSAAVPPNR